MGNRGRRSAAADQVAKVEGGSGLAPPAALEPAAAQLWRAVVTSFPTSHFTAGDAVLLAEFCRTAAVLLPKVNAQIEQEGVTSKNILLRTVLVKELGTLSAKLRLNVSARVRGDSASLKKKGSGAGLIDFGAHLRTRADGN